MSRETEPAYVIESIIDKTSLAKVTDMLAGIAGLKAVHINENWQDARTAARWQRASNRLAKLAAELRRIGV